MRKVLRSGKQISHKAYFITTTLYGIIAIFGAIGLMLSVTFKDWVLAFISLAILVLAVDNFFCGIRLSRTGQVVTSTYIVPPFRKSQLSEEAKLYRATTKTSAFGDSIQQKTKKAKKTKKKTKKETKKKITPAKKKGKTGSATKKTTKKRK